MSFLKSTLTWSHLCAIKGQPSSRLKLRRYILISACGRASRLMRDLPLDFQAELVLNLGIDYTLDEPEYIYEVCPRTCGQFGYGPCAAPSPPLPRSPPHPPFSPPSQPEPPKPPSPPTWPPSLPSSPETPPCTPPPIAPPWPPPRPPLPPPVPALPGVEVVASVISLRSRLEQLYQGLAANAVSQAREASQPQLSEWRFGLHSGHYLLNGQAIAVRGAKVIIECILSASECVLDAESQSRVFNVQEGAQLEIRRMTLVNGLSTEADAPSEESPYCRGNPLATSLKLSGALGAVPSWLPLQCGAAKPAGPYASAAGCGGAIFVDSCSILRVTEGSIIRFSTANEGGAIFAQYDAVVQIVDSSITHSRSLKNGGGISSRLDTGSGRLSLERSVLSDCIATLSGGAISVEAEATSSTPLSRIHLSDVIIRNTTCAHTTSSFDPFGGGGLYVLFWVDLSQDVATLATEHFLGTVSNTSFIECEAGDSSTDFTLRASGRGGAVYMGTTADSSNVLTGLSRFYLLHFYDTTVSRARSKFGGGGFYVSASGAEFWSCAFQYCVADFYGADARSLTSALGAGGGALAVSYGSVVLNRCIAEACHARRGGFVALQHGAMIWQGQSCGGSGCPDAVALANSTSISGCSAWGDSSPDPLIAGSGGCFFVVQSRLQVAGGVVRDSHANFLGGVLYSSGISSVILVDDVHMNNNSAGADGGVIAFLEGHSRLNRLVISNTTTCVVPEPSGYGVSRCGAIYARNEGSDSAIIVQQVSMLGNSAPLGAAQSMMLDTDYDLTLIEVRSPCDERAEASPQVVLQPRGSTDILGHSVRGLRVQNCEGAPVAQPLLTSERAPVCSDVAFEEILLGGERVQHQSVCGPGATCEDATSSGGADGKRYGVLCSCDVPSYTVDITSGPLGPFKQSIGCESLRRPKSLQVVENEVTVILHKRAYGEPVVTIRNLTLQMNGSAPVLSEWRTHLVFIAPAEPAPEWMSILQSEGQLGACAIEASTTCTAPLVAIPVLFKSSGHPEQATALQAQILVEVHVFDDHGRIRGTPVDGTVASSTNPSNLSINAELSVSADEVAAHTRWGESCATTGGAATSLEWSPLPLHAVRTQLFSACDRDRLPVQHALPALPPYASGLNFSHEIMRIGSDGNVSRVSRLSPRYVGAGRYAVDLQVPVLGTWRVHLYLGSELAASAHFTATCPQLQVALDEERCGCPQGYRERVGSGDALCQLCPADTFKDTNGSDACSFCADFIPGSSSINVLGSTSVSACKCPAGFFLHPSAEKNSSSCVQCPFGTNCSAAGSRLDELQLIPGHWRISSFSRDVRSCPSSTRAACLGGSNLSVSCRAGHRGPLCVSCERNYYSSGEGCQLCFQEGGNAIPTSLAIGIILLSLTIGFCAITCCLLRIKKGPRATGPTRVLQKIWKKRAICLVKIKIYIGCYQILSGMGDTFNVAYPLVYEALLESLSFIKLDFVQVLPMNCFMPFDFYMSLLASSSLPLLLYLLLVALAAVAEAAHHPDKSAFCTSLGIIIIFFTFPTASQTAFDFFNCDSFEGVRYLKADYDVECSGSRYDAWFPVAVFHLIVWASVPLCYCALYAYHRKQLFELHKHEARKEAAKKALLIQSESVSGRLGDVLAAEREALEVTAAADSTQGYQSIRVDLFFLTDSYKFSYFWWEALEAVRKLSLLGFLIFFEQGSLDQLMIGLLISLAAAMAYVYFLPFKAKADNAMAIICEVSNFVGLVSVLSIRESEDAGQAAENSKLGSFLVTAAVLPVILILPLALIQLLMEVGMDEKDI
ncbi:MAG: hypothetical protein SGPRY_005948, partial [Prymnesium sp.]